MLIFYPIVDQYFVVLEKVDVELDKLEEGLTHSPQIGYC